MKLEGLTKVERDEVLEEVRTAIRRRWKVEGTSSMRHMAKIVEEEDEKGDKKAAKMRELKWRQT